MCAGRRLSLSQFCPAERELLRLQAQKVCESQSLNTSCGEAELEHAQGSAKALVLESCLLESFVTEGLSFCYLLLGLGRGHPPGSGLRVRANPEPPPYITSNPKT